MNSFWQFDIGSALAFSLSMIWAYYLFSRRTKLETEAEIARLRTQRQLDALWRARDEFKKCYDEFEAIPDGQDTKSANAVSVALWSIKKRASEAAVSCVTFLGIIPCNILIQKLDQLEALYLEFKKKFSNHVIDNKSANAMKLQCLEMLHECENQIGYLILGPSTHKAGLEWRNEKLKKFTNEISELA